MTAAIMFGLDLSAFGIAFVCHALELLPRIAAYACYTNLCLP